MSVPSEYSWKPVQVFVGGKTRPQDQTGGQNATVAGAGFMVQPALAMSLVGHQATGPSALHLWVL